MECPTIYTVKDALLYIAKDEKSIMWLQHYANKGQNGFWKKWKITKIKKENSGGI